MRKTKVYRSRDQKVFADPCWIADSLWTRLVGLMGKEKLELGSGLLIRPCNSIHTFFMKFAIDAVYLDRDGKVLSIRRQMKPWRVDLPVSSANAVLELPAGAATEMLEGDLLCLS